MGRLYFLIIAIPDMHILVCFYDFVKMIRPHLSNNLSWQQTEQYYCLNSDVEILICHNNADRWQFQKPFPRKFPWETFAFNKFVYKGCQLILVALALKQWDSPLLWCIILCCQLILVALALEQWDCPLLWCVILCKQQPFYTEETILYELLIVSPSLCNILHD